LTESDSSDRPVQNIAQTTPLAPSVPPETPKQRLFRVSQNLFDSFNIGHLLLILFALHLFAMSFPNQVSPSPQYVFDEAYYVPAAQDLLHLIPSNLEHPFLGKIWGALGIYLFGNDFFGWRIFYVVIGTLTVGVFYKLARVFFSKERALLAASFLGFETLFFIHTSLSLLEGPPIFFALLGFLAYFKKRYYWSAAAFALSVLSKEWGTYFLIALFIYHVWATRRIPSSQLLSPKSLKTIILFLVILIAVIGIPLTAYDQVYHPYESTLSTVGTVVYPVNGTTATTTTTSVSHSNYVNYFWQNFQYYYSYHTGLQMSNSDYSTPWQHLAWYWVLPLDVSPAQYYVTTVTITTTSNNGTVISKTYLHPIDWLGIGNLVVWLSFWIIVPVIIFKCIRRMATQLDILIGALIVGTYAPNLLLSGFYHRVVYSFYFVNTDPALALGIPMVITFISPDSKNLQRILAAVWLGAAIVFFILFYPIHPSGSLQG